MKREQTNHQCRIINNLDTLPSKRWRVWGFFWGWWKCSGYYYTQMGFSLTAFYIYHFIVNPCYLLMSDFLPFASFSSSIFFMMLPCLLVLLFPLILFSFLKWFFLSLLIFFLRSLSTISYFLLSNHSRVLLIQQYTIFHSLYRFPKAC